MTAIDLVTAKVRTAEELQPLLSIWRFTGKKIVFTNGCFDLLHLGHIDYLAKAADLGDKLVIGLNSDRSTGSLKGPSRPITDERSRSVLLASLHFVSAVVLFDDETPYKLIEAVKPDILVKGADYAIEAIAGADLVLAAGGEVKTIPLLSGYSTTSIEKKIKSFI